MKFGLRYASLGRYANGPAAVELAQAAEAAGFESIWTVEHVVVPRGYQSRYPYSPTGRMGSGLEDFPIPDPLIWLAYIASATRSIKLGTAILILPQRNPVITAKEVASLDHLAGGGRVLLGIGVGWLAEEFEAVGVEFATRGARTRECVRALKVLWTESEPTFAGKFFTFGPVKFEPKPVQRPHPPLLFGGESDTALRRAAALGDGWYGVGHTPASAAMQRAKLEAELASAGRVGVPFEITVSHGAAGLTKDDCTRYRDAGVDRVVVLPWTSGREAEPAMKRLADAVLR
jgi:probable F420-dependent oxidoreductase